MIKGLEARIASRGKIKIGGLGEERTSKAGNKFRLPVKFDHFVITTNVRNKAGDLEVDEDLMARLGGEPRELDVVLFSNNVADFYDDWYALYDGKKAQCRGNGETAMWRREKALPESMKDFYKADENGFHVLQCTGDQCPSYKKDDAQAGCKLQFILRVILVECPAIGGAYELRSTSVHSARAMRQSLSMLMSGSNGQLAGIPLKLTLSPKTVQLGSGQSTVYVTNLEFPGRVLDLRKAAVGQQQEILLLDNSLVKASAYQEEDDPEEVEANGKEFSPDPALVAEAAAEEAAASPLPLMPSRLSDKQPAAEAPAPPDPATPAAQGTLPMGEQVISEKQVTRFHAIARNEGKKSEAEVTAYLKSAYKISSSKEIKRSDYEGLCAWAASETPVNSAKASFAEVMKHIETSKTVDMIDEVDDYIDELVGEEKSKARMAFDEKRTDLSFGVTT